jgi:hypothetical protein
MPLAFTSYPALAMTSFDLSLSTRATLTADGEPSDCISEHRGTVLAIGDTGAETIVGYVRALKLHAGRAWEKGEPLFDVCDSHSHEMHVIQSLLYQPDSYSFRDGLARRFEAYEGDLLVLDYILLDPKWRGLKIGLLAARKLVDLLGGGCGLIVSQVSPLRPEANLMIGIPAAWIPEPAGPGPLRRYFRRLGFERLGKSPFYAMPMALVTPTAEELLRASAG